MGLYDFLRNIGPSDIRPIFVVRNYKAIGKISLATFLLTYGYGVLKNTGIFAVKQGYTFSIKNSIEHDRKTTIERISYEMLRDYRELKSNEKLQSLFFNNNIKDDHKKFFVGFGITYCIDRTEMPELLYVSERAWAQQSDRAIQNLAILDSELDKNLSQKICDFARKAVTDEDISKVFEVTGNSYWKLWLLPNYAGKRIVDGFLCGLYTAAVDIGVFSSFFSDKASQACKL